LENITSRDIKTENKEKNAKLNNPFAKEIHHPPFVNTLKLIDRLILNRKNGNDSSEIVIGQPSSYDNARKLSGVVHFCE